MASILFMFWVCIVRVGKAAISFGFPLPWVLHECMIVIFFYICSVSCFSAVACLLDRSPFFWVSPFFALFLVCMCSFQGGWWLARFVRFLMIRRSIRLGFWISMCTCPWHFWSCPMWQSNLPLSESSPFSSDNEPWWTFPSSCLVFNHKILTISFLVHDFFLLCGFSITFDRLLT